MAQCQPLPRAALRSLGRGGTWPGRDGTGPLPGARSLVLSLRCAVDSARACAVVGIYRASRHGASHTSEYRQPSPIRPFRPPARPGPAVTCSATRANRLATVAAGTHGVAGLWQVAVLRYGYALLSLAIIGVSVYFERKGFQG